MAADRNHLCSPELSQNRLRALQILVRNGAIDNSKMAELIKHIETPSDEETDSEGPPKILKVARATYRSAEVSFHFKTAFCVLVIFIRSLASHLTVACHTVRQNR